MKKTTNVREHPMRTAKGDRTTRKRHPRRISGGNRGRKKNFENRKIMFDKSSYPTLEVLRENYRNYGYSHPKLFSTNPKMALEEFVIPLPKNRREHHRIFDEGEEWKIESHIDLIDPDEDPIGHIETDVIAPELDPKLRKSNFNDEQVIYLSK